MSDTLRCGQQDEVGGQLDSTKEACVHLLPPHRVKQVTVLTTVKDLGFRFKNCRITEVDEGFNWHKDALQAGTVQILHATPLKEVESWDIPHEIDTTKNQTNCSDVGDAEFLTILNTQRPLRMATQRDYLKTPPGLFDLFGDQFNQAGLAKEWGAVMAWILELRKQIPVSVYIYPTQLFTNDVMDTYQAMLQFGVTNRDFNSIGMGESCHGSFKPGVGALKRYWLNWICSTKGIYNHAGYHSKLPVFDLGPVMDFVLINSPDSALALRHDALDVEWCVQKQPNNKTNAKMVYVDIKSKLVGHCRNPVADALVSDNVKLVVPKSDKDFTHWVRGKTPHPNDDPSFVGALREAFEPDGPHGAQSSGATNTMDAVIVQDSLHPDNPISVVWLLKKVRFKSVHLVSVTQPVNFNTRKMRPLVLLWQKMRKMKPIQNASQWDKAMSSSIDKLGSSPFRRSKDMLSFLADYDSRCKEGSTCASKQGQPFGYANLNPNTLGRVLQASPPDLNKSLAWPSLFSADGAMIPQDAVNVDDSKLMEKHNMWRWKEWLTRYGIYYTSNNSQASVQIVSGGYPEMCPMSHALVPYTHFFFNPNSGVEGPDWVVDVPTYANLEEKVSLEKREMVIPRSTQLLEEEELSPKAHGGDAKVSQINGTGALIPDFLKSAAVGVQNGYAGAVFWRVGLLLAVILSVGF